jgi:hypothetical protein
MGLLRRRVLFLVSKLFPPLSRLLVSENIKCLESGSNSSRRVFDIQTHLWDRIETKVRPSGRSGHRMVIWKHYILLFGGFIDPGVRSKLILLALLFYMEH